MPMKKATQHDLKKMKGKLRALENQAKRLEKEIAAERKTSSPDPKR
jgi:hypothetical protein